MLWVRFRCDGRCALVDLVAASAAPAMHTGFLGLTVSDAVLIAIITMVGGAMKIRADRKIAQLNAQVEFARADAERDSAEAAVAEKKVAAADRAFQDLRIYLTERVNILETKVEHMQMEREIHTRVASVLFHVLSTYPDPPGAPQIPMHVAKHIGWGVSDAPPGDGSGE